MNPLFHIGDRAAFNARFDKMFPVPASVEVIESPGGRHSLELTRFSEHPPDLSRTTFLKKDPGPDFSRGVVTEVKTGRVIAEIRRNHPTFWWEWIDHPSGDQYLLCARDIAGHSVINLTSGATHHYCPDEEDPGSCFQWEKVFPSPDTTRLAVIGCGRLDENDERQSCVLFDFDSPDSLPFPRIARAPVGVDWLDFDFGREEGELFGWQGNETFVYPSRHYYRVDGMPVDFEALHELDASRMRVRVERVILQVGQEPKVEAVSNQ